MKNICTLLFSLLFINGGNLSAQKPFTLPAMEVGAPVPGKRVKVIVEGYENTNVYHLLYLPKDHSPCEKYPIIVEYTGNYAPHLGSSGEVKDASLGYATAKDLGAIWVVMPYLSEDGMTSEITWWESEEKTIEYCAKQIKEICLEYGGDPSSVFIIGFSRGAIAVNRIGLNDDRAADIWLGFHSHDHFDGHIRWCTDWANNCDYESYKADAIERARRYKGRAALVGGQNMDSVASYISMNGIDTMGELTILSVPVNQLIPSDELFINPENGSKVTHTDKWMNYESPEADFVVNWYKNIIKNKPGTFSISGIISDKNGSPLTGAIIETGFQGVDYHDACTHFTITDSSGWYELKGIVPGKRFINVVSEDEAGKILKTKNISLSENFKLDIIVDENYVPFDTEAKYSKATSLYAQKPCINPKMTAEHSSPEKKIKIVPEAVKRIDIILLMGQSNMKGIGKVPDHQEAHPRIIYMNMTNDNWYPAIHPLHTDGIPDLIDGKSNAGVGPGLNFAKVLAEQDPSACIALIPCAKGGSWIDLWMPGKTLYNESIRRARRALLDFSGKNIEVKISAALWLQGESDAIEGRYQVYREKLKILVDSLRTDLDIPDLPFISATIGPFMEAISHKYPYYKEINSILLNAGNEMESYRCVDVRDLNGHIGDHIHYNTFSQQEIGKRMAQAWLEMNQK